MGAFSVNVKVAPPSLVPRFDKAVPPFETATAKSVASAVVAEFVFDMTAIVHDSCSFARMIVVAPLHVSIEAVPGIPYTVKSTGLCAISLASLFSFALTSNVVVATLGDCTVNVNVAPTFVVVGTVNATPPTDSATKSDDRPVVAPFESKTAIWHETASDMRTIVDALCTPAQASLEAVVGTPYTANVEGLPDSDAPLASESNI